MLDQWLLKALRCLPPERAHRYLLSALAKLPLSMISKYGVRGGRPCQLGSLTLPHPVGLAAGCDKDGVCVDAWHALGFAWVECGTVTPKAQGGNPRPRLFRLPKQEALINRMGFNNDGVDALVARLKRRRGAGIVGVNLGKNKSTPIARAVDDYLFSLERVFEVTDYVTLNLSSPNTPGLRSLQTGEYCHQLLKAVMERRQYLSDKHQRNCPVFVKIAPDLSQPETEQICQASIEHGVDGLIVGNTTIDRQMLMPEQYRDEHGGLSGAPLYDKMRDQVRDVLAYCDAALPVVAVGGINSVERAMEMLDLGATALQMYTGFVYQGRRLLSDIIAEVS